MFGASFPFALVDTRRYGWISLTEIHIQGENSGRTHIANVRKPASGIHSGLQVGFE